MAKAASQGTGMKGEFLHIIILTSFMTAVFLALISAVIYLWIIPGREASVNEQVTDYNQLHGLLDPRRSTPASKDMYTARDRFREATKNQESKTLKEMVQDQLGSLVFTRFPATAPKAQAKSSTIEYTQAIELKEAPLSDILAFAGRVRQANVAVQVAHVNLQRRNKPAVIGAAAAASPSGTAEDDRWAASLDFYTSVTTTGRPAAAKPAGKVGETEEKDEERPEERGEEKAAAEEGSVAAETPAAGEKAEEKTSEKTEEKPVEASVDK
jgi:hypothetical protein